MTTPRLTPFPATTPRAGVFAPFVIISDSGDEITTLPVRPAPPSPDRTPALYGYPLDSGDDSSDEDLSETAKSLHTQTASTSVVYPPPTRPLPISHPISPQPGKEISMPLGYRETMDRWRTASPSTYHPLLPSQIPSLSSPPSLLTSSSLPPPSFLSSSSHKRSRSPLPSLPPSVSPSPPPPPTAVPPPPEHIESVRDGIETLRASLESAMLETMTLRARVRSVEQHDVKDKVANNASNKRKWEGDHGGSSSQQQNKEHKVLKVHTAEPCNKKGYAGNLPLCNKCKFHHTGPCVVKGGNCKWVGHRTRDCRTPVPRAKQRPLVAKQKAEVTCYECGRIGYYKNGCLERKNQNQVNKQWKGKTCGDSSVMANNVNV
ncbi:hypothetical protein Tco_0792888 [Tanacetum coccineum]